MTRQSGVRPAGVLALWIAAGFLAAFAVHRWRKLAHAGNAGSTALRRPAASHPEYSRAHAAGTVPGNPRGAWKLFAAEVGGFQSRLILAVVYFGIIGLFGMTVGRLRDLLRVRGEAADSYWEARESAPPSLEDNRRQF